MEVCHHGLFFRVCLDHLLNNVIFVINHKLLKFGKRRDYFIEANVLSVRPSWGTAFM